MNRWLFAVLTIGLGVSISTISRLDADEKLTNKKIMEIAHDEENGLMALIGNQLGEKEPKWDVVTEKSKEWIKVAKALNTNKPKRGDSGSWDKLTKKWLDDATALEKSAESQKLADAKTA